ncbi:DUF1471 domain-containing protein [Escherichia coli]|nr:DUF1471 domain-containing protein [Escherichia coli]EHV2437775.1 DUF1471 domain-containing protein [Escherichia coli]EJE0561597.1 DUF1471 domain-containing protein [Escherichia coli]ELR5807161.1 DUF1471 domain-containing protein [Escherichia coli]
MKTINTVVAAMALSTLSFGVFAAAASASGYSITSATNNNKLSGTAVIYK